MLQNMIELLTEQQNFNYRIEETCDVIPGIRHIITQAFQASAWGYS